MEVKKDEAELEIEGSDMLFKWTDKEWYNFTLEKKQLQLHTPVGHSSRRY
jgi:hypothetical protein